VALLVCSSDVGWCGIVELRSNVLLIERAVSTFEPRFTAKVLRTLTTLRKKLQSQPDGMSVLKQVMEESYPKSEFSFAIFSSVLPRWGIRSGRNHGLRSYGRRGQGTINGH
jgi:hypothetical protein